ncbi:type I-B CRISPR-associated protein Cas7/Cst2/DevR [Cytophagaceae bacterium YF14B1]|uniref:Type I-B CRISPR-associated protein Cas7/Cst2/DevR n=1 Tax=Xanthocytophaga flava TaxID=3048013 RepID=A0AAE3UAN8_9BACT|nr:type I-B CRISPR-associated protein Cas7/Cst2/DevR [Xanthocytophaga flavus]MDJ1485731.1 type I-B CRISPR-associated protein Cas7/Cst2/DevR [Xanthocytophaga flavus]
MNLKTQGFILLDVDVVALNNAGKSTNSNFDNAVATKKIKKQDRMYTYVSGQAWRYWWRETLQKNHQWLLSPITRENKIAFTAANPVQYADDDVFGFMKAAKDLVRDEQGNPVLDAKGKEKKEDVTVTRVSPLKNSAIISVGAVQTRENWSSMARQEGDSVPYSKEEYSAIMKGMFSLDLAQVGTFATYNKTGFKNLTEDLKKTALQNGSTEIDDLFVKDSKGNAQKLVQLPKETRVKRITDTIKALKTISGGAMQTDNMGDVTPKFIILATMTTGNHPFSHVAINDGVNNDRVLLNVEGIEEVLNDYKDQFEGTVFIGRRSGFMEEYKSDLEKLSEKFSNVKLHSINEAIDLYCSQLETQLN